MNNHIAIDWPSLNSQLLSVDDLIPYVNNARVHSQEQINQVAASINEWGFTNPILIDEKNMILAGHCRLLAAQKLKLDKVPVIIAIGWSEEQKKAYIIADNKLSLNSSWDDELLRLDLKSLENNGFNLDLVGFNSSELSELMFEAQKEGLTDEDDIPDAPEKPVTVEGDIWLLGNHRLICGDCIDEEGLKKLLNNQEIEMSFIDPPYGLDYEYNTYKDIEGAEYLAFCDKWFHLLEKYSKFNFITAGWKYNEYWIKKGPKDIFYWLSRNKQTGGKLSHFRKIEPIFLFGSLPKKIRYDLDYFDFNSDRSDGVRELHTCPKPVKFVQSAIKVITNKNVLDLFLGSGTSLIACENLNKNCFGMELDPKYCDVIIKRWQNFTGKEAVNEQTGKTYAETKFHWE